MKTKMLINLLLIVEAGLVVAMLLMKKDPWVGITCYWCMVLMNNISAFIEGRREAGGKRGH